MSMKNSVNECPLLMSKTEYLILNRPRQLNVMTQYTKQKQIVKQIIVAYEQNRLSIIASLIKLACTWFMDSTWSSVFANKT